MIILKLSIYAFARLQQKFRAIYNYCSKLLVKIMRIISRKVPSSIVKLNGPMCYYFQHNKNYSRQLENVSVQIINYYWKLFIYTSVNFLFPISKFDNFGPGGPTIIANHSYVSKAVDFRN